MARKVRSRQRSNAGRDGRGGQGPIEGGGD